jgi:hypothetical protein
MFNPFKSFKPPPPFDVAQRMHSSPASRGRACPGLDPGTKEGIERSERSERLNGAVEDRA